MLTLPWRRTHPLTMLTLAFGVNAIPQISARFFDVEWTALSTTVFLLILPYSLLRWASGREVFAGLGFVFLTFTLTIGMEDTPLAEMAAGCLFLLFPAALGASVRYREASERRARDQVRLREREQLARELHDTVAHHVSAIAIQAQAGRAQAGTRSGAAFEALEIIEEAASKTLNEMRHIVRTKRERGAFTFSPVASIADIERLASDNNGPLDIRLCLSGDLDNLDTTLASTLFRLTQEAITNAVRHADGAENVKVQISGEAKRVHLTVQDDGKPVARSSKPGFGLQGMAERTSLLGGSLYAGPAERRGWIVEVSLPRNEPVA